MKNHMSITAAALLMLAACSDGTGPAMGSGVSLSFASDVTAAGAPAPSLFGGPMAGPITDGVNTLVITSVKVVLREIELERVEVVDCDVVPEPDGCESFETAPVLIDLPVDGSTSSDVSIMIDPGTYDEVEFDIHEVTGNDDDAPFLLAHPELENKSITVEGTYNGVAFAFETNLSQEQKFNLVPALVIGEDAPATNVTIRFDVSTWFVDEFGDLFNPATASTGQPNESMAEGNIKNSIKAFEDKDKDGDDTDES
jgi:hypothetical protein